MGSDRISDKCRGSIVGGAVGDALGYEVEFMRMEQIRRKYGDQGISRYALHNGVAEFSDDTQMTLFTLEGIVNGFEARHTCKAEKIIPYIEKAYLNWYQTQISTPHPLPDSQFSDLKELWARRAPGMTCLSALENIAKGQPVINNSKGCGGVMRVAPIGIFGAILNDKCSDEAIAHLAGAASEITHKHFVSTLASALLAMTVKDCIIEDKIDQNRFSGLITESLARLQKYFPGHEEECKDFSRLIGRALELGQSDICEEGAIRELGEGWIAEEAIAVAIFSVIRHIDNLERCMICAVNHDGDSDSTGAIAGNILGAILGYSAIPTYFLEDLELRPTLVRVLDRLVNLKLPSTKIYYP